MTRASALGNATDGGHKSASRKENIMKRNAYTDYFKVGDSFETEEGSIIIIDGWNGEIAFCTEYHEDIDDETRSNITEWEEERYLTPYEIGIILGKVDDKNHRVHIEE